MKKLILILFLISAISYSQKRLELKKIGFSMDVPENWIGMNNEEVISNLNKYEFNDEQLNQLLKSDKSSVTLSTYTKYDTKSYKGIIPTIKIRTLSTKIKDDEKFLKYIQESNSGMKNALDNFQFTEQPVMVSLSGKKAVKFSVQFTLKNSGKEYEIESKSYYILKNGYYISLNFIEEVGKENNSAVFEKLISSIQLAE